ncbi:MAG: hypothetical protein RLZZ529_321 [Bacteroidota bacterium]|jgi:hypothetical protein
MLLGIYSSTIFIFLTIGPHLNSTKKQKVPIQLKQQEESSIQSFFEKSNEREGKIKVTKTK